MSLFLFCLRIFLVQPEWHEEYPVYTWYAGMQQNTWKEWCKEKLPFLFIFEVVDFELEEYDKYVLMFNVPQFDPRTRCYPKDVFPVKVYYSDTDDSIIEMPKILTDWQATSLVTELISVQKKIMDIATIPTDWAVQFPYMNFFGMDLVGRHLVTPHTWYSFLEVLIPWLPLKKRYELTWYCNYERFLVHVIRSKVIRSNYTTDAFGNIVPWSIYDDYSTEVNNYTTDAFGNLVPWSNYDDHSSDDDSISDIDDYSTEVNNYTTDAFGNLVPWPNYDDHSSDDDSMSDIS